MFDRFRRSRHDSGPRPAAGSPRASGEDSSSAAVTVVHFADPICWWSWGLEPVLRRLKEVYGEQLQVEYRMGGVFSDIAAWRRDYGVDEQGTVDWTRESVELTKNPVDVDYMRKSGVRSTHPLCRAFKAAQLQSHSLADEYFRRMMIAFQVECQPATEDTLKRLAREVGLDSVRLMKDQESAKIREAFERDMLDMHQAHATFLTLVVRAGAEAEVVNQIFTSGPIEAIIDRLAPELTKRVPVDILQFLEAHRGLTTAHEIAEVFQITDEEATRRLAELQTIGLVASAPLAGTSLWTVGRAKEEPLPLEAERASRVSPRPPVSS